MKDAVPCVCYAAATVLYQLFFWGVNYSIVWTVEYQDGEIVNMTTGLRQSKVYDGAPAISCNVGDLWFERGRQFCKICSCKVKDLWLQCELVALRVVMLVCNWLTVAV